MKIYTMSDFHLPSILEKDMKRFGWGNHIEKIKENWCVEEEDYIIIPGDLSWGLKKREIEPDLLFLDSLPGKKVLLRGNHDMWWDTRSKVERFLKEYPSITFIYNNSLDIMGLSICGTRGWDIKSFSEEDILIKNREIGRLQLSIDAAKEMEKIVFFHYPPILKEFTNTCFLDTLHKNNIKECYFGHLHGKAIEEAIIGDFEGIKFTCVASDHLDFKPLLIRG